MKNYGKPIGGRLHRFSLKTRKMDEIDLSLMPALTLDISWPSFLQLGISTNQD